MSPASRALIVNADDFGWSSGVNRGIVEANRHGILTSTTAMVNFPGFTRAAEMAKDTQDLGVGLHVNIVHGPPICDPSKVPTLVNKGGCFPGSREVLRRLMLGISSKKEIDLELNSQLELFRAELGEPTHLDSHKHMHIFGVLLPSFIEVAEKLKTPRARCPSERLSLWPPSVVKGKAAVLTYFGARARKAFCASGIATTDHFAGALDSSSFTSAACRRIVDRLGVGTTELMCHPGYRSTEDHDLIPNVAITQHREEQMVTLLDGSLKEYILENDIRLIHYGQL
jgi:predicted glycoside hydrolase/deacetylase ChbG (UPF0249 family)